jgi:CheY-like chemotaxis protein
MTQRGKLYILLVDDDPRNLSINSLLLNSSSPYLQVDPFTSSTNAILYMNKNKYDFIIADLEMPEIDGLHLIKDAKEINPDMYAILVSNREIQDLDILMSEFKVDTYIKKPYTFTRFLSEITIGIMNSFANDPFVDRILQGLKDKIISNLTEGDIVKLVKCSLSKTNEPSSSWRFVPANIYRDWTNIMWENHKMKVMNEFQKVWVQDKIRYNVETESNLEPVDKLKISRYDEKGNSLGKPVIRYFNRNEFDDLKNIVVKHYQKTCDKVKTTKVNGYILEHNSEERDGRN